jgi:GNAT superfamily N-acetyltransferase
MADLNFIIKIATDNDFVAVKEFVIQTHLEIAGYSDESKQEQINNLHFSFPELYDMKIWNDSTSWICINDERIIGCINIKKCKRAVNNIDRPINEIGYFFVDKKFRSKGIGTKLMNNVIEQTKINNIEYLYLVTLHGLMNDAIIFYKKNGFNIIDTKHTKYFSVVHMLLSLVNYTHSKIS